MAAIVIGQNLREEEKVVVARGGESKSIQTGLGQAVRQGLLAEKLKTKERFLGRLTWNMSFATERETSIAAAWNAWRMMDQFPKADL